MEGTWASPSCYPLCSFSTSAWVSTIFVPEFESSISISQIECSILLPQFRMLYFHTKFTMPFYYATVWMPYFLVSVWMPYFQCHRVATVFVSSRHRIIYDHRGMKSIIIPVHDISLWEDVIYYYHRMRRIILTVLWQIPVWWLSPPDLLFYDVGRGCKQPNRIVMMIMMDGTTALSGSVE